MIYPSLLINTSLEFVFPSSLIANAASGAARKFAPAHSGWVGITSYIDGHGTLRVKTEVLVANSTIDSDAADDDKYADS